MRNDQALATAHRRQGRRVLALLAIAALAVTGLGQPSTTAMQVAATNGDLHVGHHATALADPLPTGDGGPEADPPPSSSGSNTSGTGH